MTGIRDYSSTADANLSVAGISLAEGWARASVNNAYREGMADIANLLLDQGGGTTTTGTANTYLLNLPTAPTAYADNLLFVCKFHAAVTGASTININGLGTKDLKKLVDGVATPLSGGDGAAGHRAICLYSSAENCVLMLNTQPMFTQSGTDAVSWPITDRMKQEIYLLDFIPVAEHAAIHAGTSTFDCSDAMDDAMACVSVVTDNPTAYVGGPEIIFPYGTCYFSRTIEVKKTMTLTGHAQGAQTGFATLLKFAASITGITVNYFTTLNGGNSPGTFGGDGTTIRHLALTSLSGGVRDIALNETGAGVGHGIGHGIWCRGRTNIEHCRIRNFPQHGIYVRAWALALAGGQPEMYGNANNMYVAHVSCISNGGCGLYIDGPDTNAGLFMAMDISGNGLSAIYDSSQIGNTHIAPHAQANGADATCSYATGPGPGLSQRYYCKDASLAPTVPPVGHASSAATWGLIGNSSANPDLHTGFPPWPNKTDGITPKPYRVAYQYWFDQTTAHNVLIGPYSETGWSSSLIRYPTIVIGILVYDSASDGIKLQGGTSEAIMGPSIQMDSHPSSAVTFTTHLSRNANEAITFAATGDHITGLSFNLHSTDHSWCYQWANSGAVPIRFTNNLTTTLVGGRPSTPIPSGNVIFSTGMWLGTNTTTIRHLTMGTAAPTSGEYASGAFMFNSAPTTAASPLGWRCVTPGTPGTWQAVYVSSSPTVYP